MKAVVFDGKGAVRLADVPKPGRLDLTSLITHRMSLDDAVKAYDLFASRSENVLKIILTP